MKSFGLQDLGQYQASGLQSVVEEASPHQLIQMLLDGGMDRIATARAQIAQGDIAGKGLSIGRAIAIVDGLRSVSTTRTRASSVRTWKVSTNT